MKKRIVSYSRFSEDIRIYHLFNCLQGYESSTLGGGYYIDVGANDPIYISVTKFFYERGWKGINIEPLSRYYKRLLADRTRDINLNVAAGKEDGTLEMADFGVSTAAVGTFKGVTKEQAEYKTKTFTIPMLSLSHIVKKHNVTHCDFCKIDVEGFEKNVLLGLDFNLLRPLLFCIEAKEPLIEVGTWDEWEDILLNNGYVFIGMDEINRYYCDETKKDLLNVADFDKILENYKIKRNTKGISTMKKIKTHLDRYPKLRSLIKSLLLKSPVGRALIYHNV